MPTRHRKKLSKKESSSRSAATHGSSSKLASSELRVGSEADSGKTDESAKRRKLARPNSVPNLRSRVLGIAALIYAALAVCYLVLFVLNLSNSQLWPKILREEVFKYTLDRAHWLQRRDNASIEGCTHVSLIQQLFEAFNTASKNEFYESASVLPNSSASAIAPGRVLLHWLWNEVLPSIHWVHVARNGFNIFVFGLHHSVFAQKWVKQWLDIPLIFRRSIYMITSAGLLVHVLTFWGANPIVVLPQFGDSANANDAFVGENPQRVCAFSGVIYEWAKPTWGIAWLPSMAGLLLVVYSLASVDLLEFWGVKQAFGWGKRFHEIYYGAKKQSVDSRSCVLPFSAGPITEAGAFGAMRHPTMCGLLVFLLATPLLTIDRLFFNLFFWVYIQVAVRFEEAKLYADARGYAGYCQNVTDRFIPLNWLCCGCFRTNLPTAQTDSDS